MVIARLCGGLGNQLFQYAMARRLAERHRTELLLDSSILAPNSIQRLPELSAFNRKLGLFQFNIKAREATEAEIGSLRASFGGSNTLDRLVRLARRAKPDFLWKKSHIIERQYRFQPEALEFSDNIYLQGYWQSEKYFADISPILKHELVLVDTATADSAQRRVTSLKKRYPEVVALHVRRGDNAYAHEKLGRKDITCSAPATTEYIQKAISLLTRTFAFSYSPTRRKISSGVARIFPRVTWSFPTRSPTFPISRP